MTENVCCLKLLKKLNNCTAQTMQKKWNSFIFIHKIPSLASNLRVLFNDAAGALMAVSWNFIPIIYPETCQSQLQRGSVIAPLRWRAAPKLRRSFAAQSAHRIDADESAWICGSFFFGQPTRLPPSPQLGTRQCRQAPGRISRRVEPLHHRMHDAIRRQ